MLKNFDHLTIVVRDIERAKAFFGVLGFKEAMSVVIAGEPFASYMGVPGIEAEHVTLVLEHVSPRTEIQLLRYRHPDPLLDPNIRDLHKLGMNHICFSVDEYRQKAVHFPDHPFHAEFLGIVANPIFASTRVWHDFDYEGAAKLAEKQARLRLNQPENGR